MTVPPRCSFFFILPKIGSFSRIILGIGQVASHRQNKKDWGKCQIKEKLKGLSPVKYRTKSYILVLLLHIVLLAIGSSNYYGSNQ